MISVATFANLLGTAMDGSRLVATGDELPVAARCGYRLCQT